MTKTREYSENSGENMCVLDALRELQVGGLFFCLYRAVLSCLSRIELNSSRVAVGSRFILGSRISQTEVDTKLCCFFFSSTTFLVVVFLRFFFFGCTSLNDS